MTAYFSISKSHLDLLISLFQELSVMTFCGALAQFIELLRLIIFCIMAKPNFGESEF